MHGLAVASPIAGLLLLWITALTTLEAGPFRAACVKVEITPKDSVWMLAYGTRRSEGTHDPIFHRILALDDGDTRFVLISTDVAGISPAFHDQVVADLQAEVDLGLDQVWWTATHTHSGPVLGTVGLLGVMRPKWIERYGYDPNPEYSAWAKAGLLEGIRRAVSDLRPARLGLGTGQSRANINRRPLDLEGKAFLGRNPDGPVDRQIGLIRLEHEDGTPLALIANYAMHGTVMGGRNLKLISGDAPGIVAEYVEEEWGAPVLFINGAAGNLAPIHAHLDFTSERQAKANLQALLHFRGLLGRPILEANSRIITTSKVELGLGEVVVETPLKPDMSWASEVEAYLRTTDSGERMIQLPIHFLTINEEVFVWSMPVELFTEIAQVVRRASPYPRTFFSDTATACSAICRPPRPTGRVATNPPRVPLPARQRRM